MAGAKNKYTTEEVADAIREADGILSAAARALGCSRQTVWNYVLRYKTCEQARKEGEENLKDTLVSEWKYLVGDRNAYGHWDAVKYGLGRFAKDRGFTERVEVTGKNGESIKHDVQVSEKTRTLAEEVIAFRLANPQTEDVPQPNGSH